MTEQRKRKATQSLKEYDLLRKHHKFLRQSSDQSQSSQSKSQIRQKKQQSKGESLAKKYYSKLYKQFVLVNLERFQRGQVGCRWRTEEEVLELKGQKICGQVSCDSAVQNIYEMNFSYIEQDQKKSTLVKVSVCKDCAFKLNYKKALKPIA